MKSTAGGKRNTEGQIPGVQLANSARDLISPVGAGSRQPSSMTTSWMNQLSPSGADPIDRTQPTGADPIDRTQPMPQNIWDGQAQTPMDQMRMNIGQNIYNNIGGQMSEGQMQMIDQNLRNMLRRNKAGYNGIDRTF